MHSARPSSSSVQGEKVTGLSNTDDKGNVVSTATDEYYSHVVSAIIPVDGLFDDNLVPAVTGVTFSRFDNVISNDPTNETGARTALRGAR